MAYLSWFLFLSTIFFIFNLFFFLWIVKEDAELNLINKAERTDKSKTTFGNPLRKLINSVNAILESRDRFKTSTSSYWSCGREEKYTFLQYFALTWRMQLRPNTYVCKKATQTFNDRGKKRREKSCAIHYAGWPFRRTWATSTWRAHFRTCVRTAFSRIEMDFTKYVALHRACWWKKTCTALNEQFHLEKYHNKAPGTEKLILQIKYRR